MKNKKTPKMFPTAIRTMDGVFEGREWKAGEIFYSPKAEMPSGPGWARIPMEAGLTGELVPDTSYHPAEDWGLAAYFTQGTRKFKIQFRPDLPDAVAYEQEEPGSVEVEEAPGVRQVQAGAFVGTVRWLDPARHHPMPPPITERDCLRGEDVIDVKATAERDSRIYDSRLRAERSEQAARKKAFQDDLARILTGNAQTLPGLITEMTGKSHSDPRYNRLVQLASEVLRDLGRIEELTPEEVRAKQQASDEVDRQQAAAVGVAPPETDIEDFIEQSVRPTEEKP